MKPGNNLLAAFALVVVLCACASSPPPMPSDPAARQEPVEVKTVGIYLEYNDRMFANLDSIREMLELLGDSLEERLDARNLRGARLDSLPRTVDEGWDYLLRVRIDDYHGGPQKTVFVHYEFSGGRMQAVLKDDIRLSTVKGSSKLMRVIGVEIADTVGQRLRAE